MRYIDKLLLDVINDALSIKIPISNNIMPVVFVDQNRYDRVASCYKYDCFNVYTIHMSEDTLKANEKEIKNIIAHEILHTCNLGMDHGYVWQKYCRLMNRSLGYNIKKKYSWNDLLN